MESTPLQNRLAQQSEVAGVVVHDFNNFLNAVLLHLAVLERDLPENLHGQLNEIRRQGKQVSQIIKQWQQYRRGAQGPSKPVDLNQILTDAVAEIGAECVAANGPISMPTPTPQESSGACRLQLSLTPELPPVGGSELEIKHVCLFLLRNILAASSEGQGTILVHTQRGAPGQLALGIEDPAAEISAVKLNQWFDGLEVGPAEGPAINKVNTLELAACKNLVRRLRGKIQVGSRPAGGLLLVVELPLYRPA
jgi:signal transduction histidine kinase